MASKNSDKGDFKVTKTAAGKVPRGRGRPRSGKVEVTKVDPRVMKEALKAAGGDPKKIKIKGARRVEIEDDRYS